MIIITLMGLLRVFIGAPSADNLSSSSEYQWNTTSSTTPQPVRPQTPATFEAASRRISRIYENIMFKDDEEDEDMDVLDVPNVDLQ